MSDYSWQPEHNMRYRRKTPRKCDWCGREYHPLYRNPNPRYCGVPCSAAARRAGVASRSVHHEMPDDPRRAAEVSQEMRDALERLRKATES